MTVMTRGLGWGGLWNEDRSRTNGHSRLRKKMAMTIAASRSHMSPGLTTLWGRPLRVWE